MALFLNSSLRSRVLWKKLRAAGAAEELDSSPINFSLNELNTFYFPET
jgi:hypothetical protein